MRRQVKFLYADDLNPNSAMTAIPLFKNWEGHVQINPKFHLFDYNNQRQEIEDSHVTTTISIT